jgi:hypothetical protein
MAELIIDGTARSVDLQRFGRSRFPAFDPGLRTG